MDCLHSSVSVHDLDSSCRQTKYLPIYITYQFIKLCLPNVPCIWYVLIFIIDVTAATYTLVWFKDEGCFSVIPLACVMDVTSSL